MSANKRFSRLLNDTGTLDVISEQTSWGRSRSKDYTVQTTNGTETTLATILLTNEAVSDFEAVIVAHDINGEESATFKITAAYMRSSNLANVLAVGSPLADSLKSTGGALTWTVAYSISGNNILIRVVGEVGRTINWLASVRTVIREGAALPVQPGPSLLSGLQLWLRSDMGITTVAGDKVSLWEDQSGNNRHCSQSTDASRPLYVASAVNGISALQFDNSNDFLAGTFGLATTDFSIMAVSTMTTTGNHCIFDSSSGALTNDSHMFFQEAGSRVYRSGSTSQVAYAYASTAVMVHFATRTGSSREIFEKAVSKAVASNATAPNTMTNYRVGRLFQDVYPWHGYILEIAIYNRQLTGQEISDLTDYAIQRYAIV